MPIRLLPTLLLLLAAEQASVASELPQVSEGEGRTVLFVHGSISDHRVWEPLRAVIGERARFVAYDMRYFGESPWPDEGEGFSIDAHADDLVAQIEALGGDPVDLVTWSYSGEIALRAARARPELFRSMVHYEPAIPSLLADVPGAQAATQAYRAGFGPAVAKLEAGDTEAAALRFVEVVFKWEPGRAEREPEAWQSIWRLNGRTLPVQFAAPKGAELDCHDLAGIDVPTLVIGGGETFAYYALIAARVADCLPGAELATMDGVGHDGPYSEPEAFARRVLDFVAAHPVERASR